MGLGERFANDNFVQASSLRHSSPAQEHAVEPKLILYGQGHELADGRASRARNLDNSAAHDAVFDGRNAGNICDIACDREWCTGQIGKDMREDLAFVINGACQQQRIVSAKSHNDRCDTTGYDHCNGYDLRTDSPHVAEQFPIQGRERDHQLRSFGERLCSLTLTWDIFPSAKCTTRSASSPITML